MTLVADFNPNVSVPFSRLRQLFEDSGLQAGVVGATDLKVAQRGAGANMSVDVPAGQAWVEVTTGTRNGLAHIVNDATANVAVTASHATLPRIDQVVLQYNDSQIPTGSGDVPTLAVLAGTATSGATLDNRTGAATLGNDRLRLADILVPAASTSVTTANIRDRRPWARGGSMAVVKADSSSGPGSPATWTSIAGFGAIRMECAAGFPIELRLSLQVQSSSSSVLSARFTDNTVAIAQRDMTMTSALGFMPFEFTHRVLSPTIGTHLFEPQLNVTVTGPQIIASAAVPNLWSVREIVASNIANT